jgi:putative DNA primase/helicase
MDFQQFAEMHGLIIDHLVHDQWVRVPTTDKPRKKNGSYIWDGKSGAVKNWAVHDKAISYKTKEYRPDPEFKAKKEKQIKERQARQEKAKERAIGILNASVIQRHAYLVKKGFSEGNVWKDALVIPMMIDKKIVGCQLISQDGTKRFLSGQITKGASFTIGSGRDILTEGYATALSVHRAITELGIKAKVHVCFSAGNMLEIAQKCKNPIVIADNDPVGIRTAKKIGKYWVSDVDGEDFNDAELRLGTKSVCQSLSPLFK